MERLTLMLIGMLCLLAANGYASRSRSIDNFPEIAEYIDLAIDEVSKRYEYQIDQLHRKLEESQRLFNNELATLKKEKEDAEKYYEKTFSDLRSDINYIEEKMCPAEPNTSLTAPPNKTATQPTPGHARGKDADKETQTQNSKRDLESHEGSTNYYKEHPSAVPIPTFLTVQTKVVVNEGEMAKLRCRIENLGTKMVSWRKTSEFSPLTTGEITFTPDFRFEIAHEEISETVSEWDLIINDVRKQHAGIYECQISATDAYTMNVTLTVLENYGYKDSTFGFGSFDDYDAPVQPDILVPVLYPKEYKPVITVRGTEYVSLMGKVHLLCNVTGSIEAPNRVDWYFEGDPMDQMKPKWYGRLQVLDRKPLPGRSYISEIILEKATMEDRGNYVCRSGELADGFKVHVLNDKRPYSDDPKRDSDDYHHPDEQGSRYSMSSGSVSVSRQVYTSVLTTLCYTLFRLLLHR